MGSRRKKKTERSSLGASGVSRQARTAPITGKYKPVAQAQEAAPSEPQAAEGHARPESGKHARVGLVTRQSEDGSFELVYGSLEEDIEAHPEVEDPEPIPAWRGRVGLMVAGGLAALLLLGLGIGGAVWWMGGEPDQPRKVVAKKGAAAAQAEGQDKPYQYVPPSEIKGKLDLEGEEGEEEPAPAKVNAAQAAPEKSPMNANPAKLPDPNTKKAPLQAPLRGFKPGAALKPRLPQLQTTPLNPKPRLGQPIFPKKAELEGEEEFIDEQPPEEEEEYIDEEGEGEEGEGEEGEEGEFIDEEGEDGEPLPEDGEEPLPEEEFEEEPVE